MHKRHQFADSRGVFNIYAAAALDLFGVAVPSEPEGPSPLQSRVNSRMWTTM